MTIQEYMEKNDETYRTLAKKLDISHTYLCNVAKGWNKYISEELANKIRLACPEVDIYTEIETKYYLVRKE